MLPVVHVYYVQCWSVYLIVANLELYHLILVATSIIDRAGIPVSYLSGLVLLSKENSNPIFFTILCIIAGCLGDLLMYGAGRIIFKGNSRHSPFYRATIDYKVHRFAEIFKNRPFLWIVFSRAFQLINQFILIGVGLNKYSLAKTSVAVLLGNTLWFCGFLLIYSVYDLTLTSQSTPINIVTGVAGLFVMYLLFRQLSKSVVK